MDNKGLGNGIIPQCWNDELMQSFNDSKKLDQYKSACYDDDGNEVVTPEDIAEWRKAKVEGRLNICPCKIGDTVYRIINACANCDADLGEEDPCSDCEHYESDDYIIECEYHPIMSVIGEFGKTVFLTREAALAERL